MRRRKRRRNKMRRRRRRRRKRRRRREMKRRRSRRRRRKIGRMRFGPYSGASPCCHSQKQARRKAVELTARIAQVQNPYLAGGFREK